MAPVPQADSGGTVWTDSAHQHGGAAPIHKQARPAKAEQNNESELTHSVDDQMTASHTSVSNKATSHQSTSFSAGAKPISHAFDTASYPFEDSPILPFPSNESCTLSASQTSKFTITPSLLLHNGACGGPSIGTAAKKHRRKVKKHRQNSTPDQQTSAPIRMPSNMNNMAAEIQQIIWSHVIMTPACHTFRLMKEQDRVDVSDQQPWLVELWHSTPVKEDTSAYILWKKYWKLRNIGFMTVFQRKIKSLLPLKLRVNRPNGNRNTRHKPWRVKAAINQDQDLVILDFDRAQNTCSMFQWYEHVPNHQGSCMDVQHVQKRMRHFRKIAIHWSVTHARCGDSGETSANLIARARPFFCYCLAGQHHPHHEYKACPLELACFLDLFPNLEQFYFVVEPKRKADKMFATEYRNKVAKMGFEAKLDVMRDVGNTTGESKMHALPRFFDAKYEYLQQARRPYLESWGMQSTWGGANGPEECLIETMDFFKSKKGTETFRQKLKDRKKVRFGILIRSPLESDMKVGPPEQTEQAEETKKPVKPKPARKLNRRYLSR